MMPFIYEFIPHPATVLYSPTPQHMCETDMSRIVSFKYKATARKVFLLQPARGPCPKIVIFQGVFTGERLKYWVNNWILSLKKCAD